jgi:hypothetical protein
LEDRSCGLYRLQRCGNEKWSRRRLWAVQVDERDNIKTIGLRVKPPCLSGKRGQGVNLVLVCTIDDALEDGV